MIPSFEVYNTTLGAGLGDTIEVVSNSAPSGVIADEIVEKFAPADGFMVSVVGTNGKFVSVRVDTDTGEFFKIPANQTVTFKVPVKKKVEFLNDSDTSAYVSIAFIRGRNR